MCLGIPGKITRTWHDDGHYLGEADFAGEPRLVRLDYLPELVVGDWTILHAGFALTKLDEEEAHETLATMREAGLLAAAVEPVSPTPMAQPTVTGP